MTDLRETVGVIGLGAMGAPMALNLCKAGADVVVWSRRPESLTPVVDAGAHAASSPREVGERSTVVVLVLPDGPDVHDVVFREPDGLAAGLLPGSLVIDCTTCSPGASKTTGERLREMGSSYLDAPVSGGTKGAQEATLSIMVGGDPADFERAGGVLGAMGRTIVHVGGPGAGQVAKACNQLIVASNIEAVAEALVLAATSGVDPRVVREVLLGGLARSAILESHGARMLDRTFAPGFRNALQLKDARIVLEQSAEVGAPVLAFERVVDQLEALVARDGAADLDHSSLVLRSEDLAGVSLTDPVGGRP